MKTYSKKERKMCHKLENLDRLKEKLKRQNISLGKKSLHFHIKFKEQTLRPTRNSKDSGRILPSII